MRVRLNRMYRTRDGKTVAITGIDNESRAAIFWPMEGSCVNSDFPSHCFSTSGKWDEHESDMDLVEELGNDDADYTAIDYVLDEVLEACDGMNTEDHDAADHMHCILPRQALLRRVMIMVAAIAKHDEDNNGG